jgi:hypothetical protein
MRSTVRYAVRDLHLNRPPVVVVEVHVKNFRTFHRRKIFRAAVACCVAFTGSAVGWADPGSVDYVEDPLAPHKTTGNTARLGTAVGYLSGEPLEATALGLTVAGGRRWGRFALEAEYSYFDLSARGPSSTRLGDAQRLGVIGRLEVIRLGSHIVGGNSMLAVYIEGGAGVAWNDWYRPSYDEPTRIVPADSKRVEGQVGFGIMLDHRLQEPIGFPHRIGWYLGWRMAVTPHNEGIASICRGASCKPMTTIPDDPQDRRFVDRSMLFQSALFVTW